MTLGRKEGNEAASNNQFRNGLLRRGLGTAPRGRAMPIHRFHIGQTVFLTPSLGLNIPGGACIITKQLPERDGEYEYRVRIINEPHERVVSESQMRLAGD